MRNDIDSSGHKEYFQTIFNAGNDAVGILKDGVFIDCNSAMLDFLGCTSKDVIGKNICQISPEFQASGLRSVEMAEEMFSHSLTANHGLVRWSLLKSLGDLIETEISVKSLNIQGLALHHLSFRDISKRLEDEKYHHLVELRQDIALSLYKNAGLPTSSFFGEALNSVILVSNSEAGCIFYLDAEQIPRQVRSKAGITTCEIGENPWDILVSHITDVTYLSSDQSGAFQVDLPLSVGTAGWKAVLPLKDSAKTIGFMILGKSQCPFETTEKASLILMSSVISEIFVRQLAEDKLKESQRQMETLFANLPGMAYRCKNDKQWTMEFCSKGAFSLTGYSADDLIDNRNVSYNAIIREDYQIPIYDIWQSHLKEKKEVQTEYPIITRDGNEKWVWEKGCGVFDEQGDLVALEGFISDITDKKRAEDALRESERRYELAIAGSDDAVYDWYPELKKNIVNDRWFEMLGYSKHDFPQEDDRFFFDLMHPEDFSIVHDEIRRHLEGKTEQYSVEFRMKCKNGDWKWILSRGKATEHDEFGNLVRLTGTHTDISGRKEVEEKLKYLSLHDQLTGLYNRLFFETELGRLEGGREYPVSIISLDVDGLKLVNDTIGHDAGDRLLVACADIMRLNIRTSEIAARIGGDEFAVLLPRTSEDEANVVVERLKNATKLASADEVGLPVAFSIGLATAYDGTDRLEQVMQRADALMYREKLCRNSSVRSQIVDSLLAALAERDYIADGHASRMEFHCGAMGNLAGLSPAQIHDLRLLARIHDLGKVGIPDNILFKPGPLTEKEWKIMRQHPEKGYRIASSSHELAGVADLILKHHEHFDGRGYPLGIAGEVIPIECRILSIVDAYDAMVSERPYAGPQSSEEALEEIKRCSGSQFDPALVELFMQLMEIK